MNAARYIGNGALEVVDTEAPQPSPEVQLEVAYTGICGTDLHILHGAMDVRVTMPAANFWLDNLDNDKYFAAPPGPAMKASANLIWKGWSMVTYPDQPSWSNQVVAKLIQGKSLSSLLPGLGKSLSDNAKAAGYKVVTKKRPWLVVADVAPDSAEGLLAGNALRLYRLDAPTVHGGRGRVVAALTDQAIAEIKNLIMSGEFVAGSRLPKEQDLPQRLGLSRNSLREAVRALTLIGVLEPRVGDGTYVTSLEPELLLTGMGFISDLLTGATLLELHQVRRILEPVATELATPQLDDADFTALENCLADMDAAERTQAFIAADEEFHRIVVTASGNSTLASLIQNLSGGTLRARLWRSVKERDAIEVTKRRHWDIYNALRDRDAKRAAAADLIHLSEGEQWLRQLMQAEDALAVLATVPPDTDLSGNGDENAGSAR